MIIVNNAKDKINVERQKEVNKMSEDKNLRR